MALILFLYGMPVGVNGGISTSMCFECFFFGSFFCMLVLSHLNLLVSSYFTLLLFLSPFLFIISFLVRNRKSVWLWLGGGSGEKLGVVMGRETINRIYCMKKMCFNKK